MSLSFDQIVSDAKKLVNRLRQRESDADDLLKETQTVKWKIDDFNQYREEVETLNKTFNENGRSLNYLATLKDDNSYLANLQKENQQLQALIEDYQNVMEHIMLKYRKHVARNIFDSHLDLKAIVDQYQSETIMKQAEKINEMISVMSYAASIDDDTSTKVREIIAQLYKENQVLRELLKISKDYGGPTVGLPAVPTQFIQITKNTDWSSDLLP